ncbi:MAG: phosphate ABC transporter substrate-binding protein PstS [Proteobacteria bacterium]|nr:phosphate ABC transporter substrate-binding protein PstS [Pseudomonadota bacterium]
MHFLRLPALVLLVAFAPLGAWAQATSVSGTGATFPAQVYAEWARQYTKDTGVALNYVPSGSSTGVKQIVARAVDFGATDVPLGQAELDKNQLFQFPTLVGGVVPVVNLPGVASGALRLDAQVLAGIFSGDIARWNDKAIAALNPGLALPDTRIARVVRSDGSGTTEVFVQFLKQAAPAASAAIEGQGATAKWPGTTMPAEGSSKLASAVKATPGAIGYVSSDYVLREHLSAASLRNKRGEWVLPSTESFAAASRAGALFKTSLEAAPLLDIDGPGVWPIVTATYVLVPRSPASAERAGRTLNFFYRSFLLGDKAVAGTGFAPLPLLTQARIVSLLTNFRSQDGKPIPVLGQAGGDTFVASSGSSSAGPRP